MEKVIFVLNFRADSFLFHSPPLFWFQSLYAIGGSAFILNAENSISYFMTILSRPSSFSLRYTTFLLSPTLIQMRLRRKTFQRYALKWFRLIVQIPLSSFIFVRYHFCCYLFLSKIKKRGNYISCATFFFQSLILFSHFQSLHRWE